jgi:N-acetylglutamate synthase-like GNAT family acetyltransferase
MEASWLSGSASPRDMVGLRACATEFSLPRPPETSLNCFAMRGPKTDRKRQEAILIRAARESDFEVLCSFDQITKKDQKRRESIQHAIACGSCFIAEMGQEVIGYGALNYSFYDHGFVNVLYVAADWRRQGAGAMLLDEMERQCQTSKLFTSTNLSNLPMHSLLAQRGYVLAGVIHELDQGDPEIVYCKRLR